MVDNHFRPRGDEFSTASFRSASSMSAKIAECRSFHMASHRSCCEVSRGSLSLAKEGGEGAKKGRSGEDEGAGKSR